METLPHLAGHSNEGQVPDMVKLGLGDSVSPCLSCQSWLRLNIFMFARWLLSEPGAIGSLCHI